jgi:hypothetical protein
MGMLDPENICILTPVSASRLGYPDSTSNEQAVCSCIAALKATIRICRWSGARAVM